MSTLTRKLLITKSKKTYQFCLPIEDAKTKNINNLNLNQNPKGESFYARRKTKKLTLSHNITYQNFFEFKKNIPYNFNYQKRKRSIIGISVKLTRLTNFSNPLIDILWSKREESIQPESPFLKKAFDKKKELSKLCSKLNSKIKRKYCDSRNHDRNESTKRSSTIFLLYEQLLSRKKRGKKIQKLFI